MSVCRPLSRPPGREAFYLQPREEAVSPVVVYLADNITLRSQARLLLALAAKEQYGLSPLPPISRAERGKPFFPDHPEINFSLSHSGTLALCALDSAPVGADIQTAAPRRPAMVERCCSPEERVWLAGRGDSPEAFALLWSLKEAMVKHSGKGLTLPISAIRPPLPRGEETLLEQDGLYFRLYAGPGWRGAVCGLTPPPELRRRPLPPQKNL